MPNVSNKDWLDFDPEGPVGQGWRKIVENLDKKLTQICPGYTISQIKEKFGGLRYYIQFPEGTDEYIRTACYSYIDRAEEDSMRTCEKCGGPGKIDNWGAKYWVVCLCVDCGTDRMKGMKK